MHPLKVGGLEDHLHLVLGIPPALSVSRAVQLLKGSASRWIRLTFPELEAFRWQDRYGAFTVSMSNLPATITYVEQQRERHIRRTFQDEFRTLLTLHRIAYDERFYREGVSRPDPGPLTLHRIAYDERFIWG